MCVNKVIALKQQIAIVQLYNGNYLIRKEESKGVYRYAFESEYSPTVYWCDRESSSFVTAQVTRVNHIIPLFDRLVAEDRVVIL